MIAIECQIEHIEPIRPVWGWESIVCCLSIVRCLQIESCGIERPLSIARQLWCLAPVVLPIVHCQSIARCGVYRQKLSNGFYKTLKMC